MGLFFLFRHCARYPDYELQQVPFTQKIHEFTKIENGPSLYSLEKHAFPLGEFIRDKYGADIRVDANSPERNVETAKAFARGLGEKNIYIPVGIDPLYYHMQDKSPASVRLRREAVEFVEPAREESSKYVAKYPEDRSQALQYDFAIATILMMSVYSGNLINFSWNDYHTILSSATLGYRTRFMHASREVVNLITYMYDTLFLNKRVAVCGHDTNLMQVMSTLDLPVVPITPCFGILFRTVGKRVVVEYVSVSPEGDVSSEVVYEIKNFFEYLQKRSVVRYNLLWSTRSLQEISVDS